MYTRHIKTTDHKGVKTRYEYDDIGRVLATVKDYHASGGGSEDR